MKSAVITTAVFDRSDQINQNSRRSLVPPQGCWVKRNKRRSLYNVERSGLLPPNGVKKPNFVSLLSHVCTVGSGDRLLNQFQKKWWSLTGSNRRHPACKAGALPAELRPHSFLTEPVLVGPGRLELPTSRLSGVRSNQLSYGPDVVWTGLFLTDTGTDYHPSR